MSKPWGAIGAWAADAERAEAEERERLAKNPQESQSFPSLHEAVATKPKKKKPAAMSLSQFTSGTHVGPGGAARRDFSNDSKGLTPDEMLRLPTGPKERSADEMEYGRLGGGFKSYGGGGGGGGRSQGGPPMGRMGRSDEGREGSWGGGGGGGGGGRRSYGGGFDDERRSAQPPREYDLPSRADEVDNWATSKKPLPPMDSGRYGGGSADSGRQDRYSSLGGGSRADEVDNWASGKKAIPARSSSFGSGFRDPVAPESDRWSRAGPLPPRDPLPPREGDRERPRLVLDPPRGDGSSNDAAKTNKPSPFGAARPREEVLAEKGLDWKKLDSDIDSKKTSRPTSSQSSRPSSAHSTRSENPAQLGEGAPKARPKVNPFGDAKPREVLLQEKGKDWRKMDFELEHRSVDRPETIEEQSLKEVIENLKKELEKLSVNGEMTQEPGGEEPGVRELLAIKEKELELLVHELDDKVRFGQKASERPGSGSGRSIGFPERPPSQSGTSEDNRNVEYIDRPRSRGTGDVWNRPAEDRRAFQGGREGGYFNSRDDRPRSRERW